MALSRKLLNYNRVGRSISTYFVHYEALCLLAILIHLAFHCLHKSIRAIIMSLILPMEAFNPIWMRSPAWFACCSQSKRLNSVSRHINHLGCALAVSASIYITSNLPPPLALFSPLSLPPSLWSQVKAVRVNWSVWSPRGEFRTSWQCCRPPQPVGHTCRPVYAHVMHTRIHIMSSTQKNIHFHHPGVLL